MSQALTITVSDMAYTELQRRAQTRGESEANVVAQLVEESLTNGTRLRGRGRDEREDQAARERFERCFGEMRMGYATGVDNESIDADLAREYADDHERG